MIFKLCIQPSLKTMQIKRDFLGKNLVFVLSFTGPVKAPTITLVLNLVNTVNLV